MRSFPFSIDTPVSNKSEEVKEISCHKYTIPRNTLLLYLWAVIIICQECISFLIVKNVKKRKKESDNEESLLNLIYDFNHGYIFLKLLQQFSWKNGVIFEYEYLVKYSLYLIFKKKSAQQPNFYPPFLKMKSACELLGQRQEP